MKLNPFRRRSRVTVNEFGSALLALHSSGFDPSSLQNAAGTLALRDDAIFDWMIFGAWTISVAVTGNCKNERLRNVVLDSFLDQLHLSLRRHGMSQDAVSSLSGEMHRQFGDYHRAWHGGSVQALALAVSRTVIGSSPEAGTFGFGRVAVSVFAVTVEAVKGLFETLKIKTTT